MNCFQRSLNNLGNLSEGIRNIVLKRNLEDGSTELSEIAPTDLNKDPPKVIFELQTSECSCVKIENLYAYLETSEMKTMLNEKDSVLVLKVKISESLNELSSDDLNELNNLCKEKSIVLLLTAVSDFKCFIYWKFNEMSNFLTISHYNETFVHDDREVYKYIANFLGDCLTKKEMGFCKRYILNQTSNKIELPVLADYRNFNLLLLAAESGNVNVIESLLQIGLCEESLDKSINAQSLAWQNRHSDVLIALAKHDLQYPDGIDVTQLSETFKSFYQKTEDFHSAIRSKNVEKVKKYIYNNNSNIKYFFNIENASAARIAIQVKAFAIYEILLANGITLLQNEKTFLKELTKREQRQIREIHTKYSKDLKDKHISILMAHSYIGHNASDPQEKLKLVKKAYETLSQDARLNTILIVVASSRKLKIVYDFNNESVDTVDPTSSAYTEGIFYPTGRIYIGAKQLLNEVTKYKTLSTIIHELGHYAMNLTYENNAKPYKAKDTKAYIEFCKIFNDCIVNAPNETFIHLVYEAYPKEIQHAELIVRAPHLIALYLNQPDKLKNSIRYFPKLFEHYENQIMPNMMKVLPDIEERIERRMETLFEERKWFKICSVVTFIFLIATGIFAGYLVHKEHKHINDHIHSKITSSVTKTTTTTSTQIKETTATESIYISYTFPTYISVTSIQTVTQTKDPTFISVTSTQTITEIRDPTYISVTSTQTVIQTTTESIDQYITSYINLNEFKDKESKDIPYGDALSDSKAEEPQNNIYGPRIKSEPWFPPFPNPSVIQPSIYDRYDYVHHVYAYSALPPCYPNCLQYRDPNYG